MAAPTNHYKLGLFVLLGVAAAIAVAVGLGAQSMRKETVTYHTYFNESVQGLDVGSPVKFRGVTIGHVAAIEVAPDHRHVEVIEELDVRDIKRLGLTDAGVGHSIGRHKARFLVPPDLRAQLGSQGITGVKFIAIDFFDEKTTPALALPFPPPENYIPAATSMMKNLEDTISKAAEKLPELVDAVVAITSRIDRMVAQLEKDQVSEKTASTLTHADEVLTSLGVTVKRIESSGIADKTAGTLDDLHVAVNKMNKVLDRIDGEAGLIASATKATDAFGAAGKSAGGSARELDATMREIRDAAEAIRTLAEALEKDPDMLVKGRAAVKGKTR
jgi:phospholipid/cholesterol/gamma-HCH transport system substrate-binding protein